MARERAWKQGPVKTADQEAARTLLMRLEDDWMASRLRGEAASSRKLLDDSYRGATSEGRPQTKAEFIQAIESAKGFFKQHTHSSRGIVFRGDTAISTGAATLDSPGRKHAFRYLRVYVKNNGEWSLIASQSTPLD